MKSTTILALFLSLALACTLSLTGCAEDGDTLWKKGEFKEVSPKHAVGMVQRNPEIILLDVRTPEEIVVGKIDGALELNYHDPAFSSKLEEMDKTKPYLVYCQSGNRSGKTIKEMKKKGFVAAYGMQDSPEDYLEAQKEEQ